MEDAVYVCGWKKDAGGFVLWVKSIPQIQCAGRTYAEAEKELLESIWRRNGAIHAVLEFDPPLPPSSSESRYCDPELFLIGGDERFETCSRPDRFRDGFEQWITWVNGFFRSPVCRSCRQIKGPRNDRLLPITYAPSQIDGASGTVGGESVATIQIVSDQFLGLLTRAERDQLHLQRVERGRRKRDFWELVGPAGLDWVAVKGLKPSGWKCPTCGFSIWGYWIQGFDLSHFIAKSDLPSDHPSIFTVVKQPNVHLAVTAKRWGELCDRRGTRGFVSERLGVVPDNEVLRQIDLPTRLIP